MNLGQLLFDLEDSKIMLFVRDLKTALCSSLIPTC